MGIEFKVVRVIPSGYMGGICRRGYAGTQKDVQTWLPPRVGLWLMVWVLWLRFNRSKNSL